MINYKIETFSNTQTSSNIPATPNNETCYNYIKNVKNWNVSDLTSNQQKVLFTMRALLGSQFSDNTKTFPFKDGCVIPSNHLPIYDIAETSTSLTVNPPNKQSITINATDSTMYPKGLYVDFTDPTMDYNKFKDFLDGAYLLYDSSFFVQQESLLNEIKRLKANRDNLKQNLANLVTQTNNVNNMATALQDPNSQCQQIKSENVNTLIPEWNNLIDKANYYAQRYDTLVGYINDGLSQVANLNQTYLNFESGIWQISGNNGSVNNLASLPSN